MGQPFAIQQGERHLPQGTGRKQETANSEGWLLTTRLLVGTPNPTQLLWGEVLAPTGWANKFILAFQYKELLSQQQRSSKVFSISFKNTWTRFISPLVQKSCRTYDHSAPNPQQQLHHNKPQPACSSNHRYGSPISQTPATATKPFSSAPQLPAPPDALTCCIHLCVLAGWLASLQQLLTSGLEVLPQAPSCVPFYDGEKLSTYLFSTPCYQHPAPPAAYSGSAAAQALGTWVSCTNHRIP